MEIKHTVSNDFDLRSSMVLMFSIAAYPVWFRGFQYTKGYTSGLKNISTTLLVSHKDHDPFNQFTELSDLYFQYLWIR